MTVINGRHLSMRIDCGGKRTTHDRLLLLFEVVSGVFAHGQLHILNVIFRLTAVCELAMSNKKRETGLNAVCLWSYGQTKEER